MVMSSGFIDIFYQISNDFTVYKYKLSTYSGICNTFMQGIYLDHNHEEDPYGVPSPSGAFSFLSFIY
jgi:hypothetical protein